MAVSHQAKPRRMEEPHPHPYGAKEICRLVGISHRQLDYWVLIGVVRPYLERHGAKLFRRFSQQDAQLLQRIKRLIDEGVVVSRAAERVRREMGMAVAPPLPHPEPDGPPTPSPTHANDGEPGHDH